MIPMSYLQPKTAEAMIDDLTAIDTYVADSGEDYGFIRQYEIEEDHYILQISDELGFSYYETKRKSAMNELSERLLNPNLHHWDVILNSYEILGHGNEVDIEEINLYKDHLEDGELEDNIYRIMQHKNVGDNETEHSWVDDENWDMVLLSLDEALEKISEYEGHEFTSIEPPTYTIHKL